MNDEESMNKNDRMYNRNKELVNDTEWMNMNYKRMIRMFYIQLK